MAASKKSAPDAPAPTGGGENPKFEQALARLEQIVETLAEGDLPLDQSLAVYKEGISLVKFCQTRLKEVEQEIVQLTPGADGEPIIAPFDDDEG